MDKVMVYYHKDSDTMDIWFGNPGDEVICEEAGDGIILKKDKNGKTIGIEKLYVSKIPQRPAYPCSYAPIRQKALTNKGDEDRIPHN